MQHRSRFARQLCIGVDTEGYSRRDNVAQYDVQSDLPGVLIEAAEGAGLNRSSWATQQRGDGEIALIPPDEPEPRLIDDFVRELVAVLQLRNYGRNRTARMRLRLSFDFGVAYEAPLGFAGAAVVSTARLLDSHALHQALRDDDKIVLAVALSTSVYQTVLDRHTSLTPDDYTKVRVREKEYTGDAWIRTLPQSAKPTAPSNSEDRKTSSSESQATSKHSQPGPQQKPGTSYRVRNEFHDHVDAGVIGINFAPPDDRP